MADELDDFLGVEDVGQAEASTTSDPSAAAKPPEAPAVRTPAEPREPADPALVAEPAADDADHPVPDDVAGLRAAMLAERTKRKDYKGERDRLAGEMAAIKAELEAARRPPPPPAAVQQEVPPQPQPIPSAIEDPAGWQAYWEHKAFNDRLNMSEIMLRSQHDDADVDAKIAVFRKALAANPALNLELKRQVHPYRWAYQQAERMMAMEEIGPDLSAYRQKIAAEERAKIEAELAGGQPAAGAAARVVLPQSLGTARSAAPRSAAVFNVPETFDDILASPRR